MRRLLAIVALLGLGLLLVACGGRRGAKSDLPTAVPVEAAAGSRASAPAFPAQVSEGGRVVVEVMPLNLDQPETTLHFQVAMNTHSVELDYDLTRLALLRTDQGDEVKPLRWEGSRGGHHVNGVLYFPAVELDNAQWVEVVIRDVAGIPERVFRWDLKP